GTFFRNAGLIRLSRVPSSGHGHYVYGRRRSIAAAFLHVVSRLARRRVGSQEEDRCLVWTSSRPR
ncbi:hypothetical protein ACX4M1_18410, partial [Roseomonas mucosa]